MKPLHLAAAIVLTAAATLTGMFAVAATAATTLAASNDLAVAKYRTPASETTSTTNKRKQKP